MVKLVSRMVLFGILAVLVLWSSPVAAQNDGPADISVVSEFGGSGGLPDSVDAFGIGQQWAFLHASQWTAWGNPAGGVGYGGSGYIYPVASGDDFWAQLRLPVGAQINWIHWYVYDADAACRWYLTFTRYEGAEAGQTPALEQLAVEGTTNPDASGYSRINTDLTAAPVVINSWEDIDGDSQWHYTTYNVTAELLACGGNNNMRLFGTGFNWSRVVTPAPASATFLDVPTGHWAFRFIEALVDSGITSGCGGGNYCPNNNVTRAEMAVFLAGGLGLHWNGIVG